MRPCDRWNDVKKKKKKMGSEGKNELSEKIFEKVRKFNALVKDNVTGPNCVDSSICKGDCCFIHIDVPRALAQYYLDQDLAEKSDFERGETFNFRIAVDLQRLKCVFFSEEVNGCSLHFTGMKPPQCWVYPTGFDPEDVKHECKRAKGWEIVDDDRAIQAKKTLDQYVELCKKEFEKEFDSDSLRKRISPTLSREMLDQPPRALAGVREGWDCFELIYNDGFNMAVKSFCDSPTSNCSRSFFECESTCEIVAQEIYNFLVKTLPRFVEKHGAKKNTLFLNLRSFNCVLQQKLKI